MLNYMYIFINKNFEWREKNRMDDVISENLTYFETEYPMYTDGFARDGSQGTKWSRKSLKLSL
jgi:hypothetical protein